MRLVYLADGAWSLLFTCLAGRSLTWARLWLRARRVRRYVPGTFRFPFGLVRYVDIRALRDQYNEIFLRRSYDAGDLGPAPVILDCGANIGMSAFWFGRRYPQAAITAYEADPAIAAVLEGNIRRLARRQVRVVRAAVTDRSGTVPFITEGSDAGYVGAGDPRQVDVPARRLSDEITGPVSLLKLDIEGSEFAVLHDLCATGKIADVQTILCELHVGSRLQSQLGVLLQELTDAGFRLVLHQASVADRFPGPAEPTPLPSVPGANFLVLLAAWRPSATRR